MRLKLVSLIALLLVGACSIGMPSNVAVGIGGGNHNFGLGTTINFPIRTKPVSSEPPVIAGTEPSGQPEKPAAKTTDQKKQPINK